MSKTVIIPGNMDPWCCAINGVPYGPWPAGTEQTVPDEVAAVIENYYASQPRENPPETDEEMAKRIADEEIAKAAIVTSQIASVTKAGEDGPTADDFNGLLDAIVACGLLAAAPEPESDET